MMLNVDPKVVRAIARKDLFAYLGNPTGYVFLTLFIAATAAAAFLQEGFFARNLADLAMLNRLMPIILMFFVPAVTMGAWSDERRLGTDEMLLTLPVRDAEVVVGKYLGALGMYTVALAFSLSHLIVLMVLGSPDVGLMFATYVGYWLVGVLFVALGLLGSMLTNNATVAFILGTLACAAFVFAGTAPWTSGIIGVVCLALLATLVGVAVRGTTKGSGLWGAGGAVLGMIAWLIQPGQRAQAAEAAEAAEASADAAQAAGEAGAAVVQTDATSFWQVFDALSVSEHFSSFGEGVLRLGDVLFFVGGAALVLYLAGFLLGRRHW